MLFLIICIVLVIIILIQYFNSEKLTHNTCVAFVGTMGSGKTFMAVKAARQAYKRQKLKRFFCLIFPPLRLFVYNWKVKPTIYSNIPIKVSSFGKRQYSYVLRTDHLLRRKALPEGAIVVIDELGQFASQWDYDNPYIKEQVADFTRFYRHWINGRMFVTDQSSDNIVKAIRCRLGLIYHLNDFRRWCGVFPFFKVDVTPLLMLEDSKHNENVITEKRSYFFGFMFYKRLQRLLRLDKYNSRCYSDIYLKGATNEPTPFDSSLKTRYLIDISVSKQVSKDYAADRQRYKHYLYLPLSDHRGGAGEDDTSPAPLDDQKEKENK